MCAFFFAATLGCCLDRRKSVGPSAPIAYATSVSQPNEAAAWPGAAFLQITFHAGCRHTHFWQGVAWMVRPICAHRARYRKLIVWLLAIYILAACAVICRKAIVMLPEANFLFPWCQSPASRAQKGSSSNLVLSS